MLEKIEYVFPKDTKSIELFNLLSTLFRDIEYVTVFKANEIHAISSNLSPKTVFKLDSNISNIQLNIENQKYVNLLNRKLEYNKASSEVIKLPIKDVATKLTGHIRRIDHTGINLPASLYSKEDWKNLLKYFSSISNIYNYPTGEPWTFLIPTTVEENQNEITNFEIIREPRFELVYDDYTNIITIQIDIETNLSKTEVENLFPKNQGIYFKGLEDVYKAIYLDYSDYIDIRLDIRFKGLHGEFESGEWLVNEGKRII